MKKFIILAFAIFLFNSCQKKTLFFKEATLIGIDLSECGCCGGYYAVVENDTLLTDFDLFDDSEFETDSIQFPFELEIKYKSLSSCTGYNRIEVSKIKID